MAERSLSESEEAQEIKALQRVVGAFLNYPSSAEQDVRRWERSFSKLTMKHKELMSHLTTKYSEVRRCIAENFDLILCMLRNFDPPFQIEDSSKQQHCEEQNGILRDHGFEDHQESKRIAVENDGVIAAVGVQAMCKDCYLANALEHLEEDEDADDWFQSLFNIRVPPADVDKVRCVIRNIVRDWTMEGALERDKCYKPILEELKMLFPEIDPKSPPTCLVPGAGLGRLCLEISRLGFVSQGNEFSYFMLICSNFILNHTSAPFEFAIYPWIHSNCNKVKDSDQLRATRFPDLHPGSAGITEGFSMCAGDFVEVYSHPDQAGAWDAVATCFFLDTAHNILQYIELIYKILKPGGVWINLGPLLYHFADPYSCSADDEMSLELCLEDVKKAALHCGFKLRKEATVQSTYTSCPTSMMQNHYYSAFWIMIKT